MGMPVRGGMPIRDSNSGQQRACCDHPLAGLSCLRPGPRKEHSAGLLPLAPALPAFCLCSLPPPPSAPPLASAALSAPLSTLLPTTAARLEA